jgi:NhaC family Na+:H+ antiporter
MVTKLKSNRKATRPESISCLIVLLIVLTIFTLKKVGISVALFTSMAYMVLIGLRCGHTMRELLEAMTNKIASIADLTLLLTGIGFLIAALVFGGSIPTLITYLMKAITPAMCIPLSFILTALTAFFIGTSFGTAGTMGVILVTLGAALNVNMPLLAGAVISGAHVGLFISPMSDNFNTTASLGKADTSAAMKRAMYIAVPTLIICVAFYVAAGLIGGVSGTGVNINEFGDELRSIFHINPLALIPIIYIFVASFMKIPAIIALFSGGFIAIICGALLNGFSIWQGLACTLGGFNLTDVTGIAADSVLPQVITLCNRGGMYGMIELFAIIFPAMAMAGLMIKIGVVDVIVSSLLGNVKSPLGLALSNWIIGFVTSITTSASAISIIMPFEMMEKKYEELGYSKLDCAVMCNTIASPIMCITPWTDVGVYMSGIVGVSVLSYLPYCIWGWGLGLVAIICPAFKFGYKKKTAVEMEPEIPANPS